MQIAVKKDLIYALIYFLNEKSWELRDVAKQNLKKKIIKYRIYKLDLCKEK